MKRRDAMALVFAFAVGFAFAILVYEAGENLRHAYSAGIVLAGGTLCIVGEILDALHRIIALLEKK